MLLLSNGLVLDGSGSEPFRASVLIDGASIAAIGPDLKPPDCPTLDCSQLAVSPGFIDLHSHADLQVVEERPEKFAQGITTEVVGNCGFSPFPYDGHVAELKEFAGGILGRAGNRGWPSAAAYLNTLVQSGADKRAFPLVGHGSLRVCGLRQDPLSTAESDRLAGFLEDALLARCVGFSTGLMYAPGSSAGKADPPLVLSSKTAGYCVPATLPILSSSIRHVFKASRPTKHPKRVRSE